jgi:hypothetical protein
MLTPRYVRIKKFAELTGWTEKAVYMKMHTGVWIEGQQYKKAPDGNPVIDLEGYERWVEGGLEAALNLGPARSV